MDGTLMSGTLGFVLFVVFFLSVCALTYLCVNRSFEGYWAWDDIAVEIRKRKKRKIQYMKEYLVYGFSKYEAEDKASKKLFAEAKEAENVKP